MAVARALKLTAFLSDIRSCDHASHAPLITHRQFSRDLAIMIQIIQSHRLLIATDLQYRIRRGIDDHFSFIDLLLAKLIEDHGSAGCFVSNDFSATALL